MLKAISERPGPRTVLKRTTIVSYGEALQDNGKYIHLDIFVTLVTYSNYEKKKIHS